jgi:serine protease AprX
LAELKPGEYITAIVRLKTKADIRDVVTIQNAAGKAERRAAVISYLQEFAAKEQRTVLQAMANLEAEGLVKNVQPLWLANAIGLDLAPDAIRTLSQYSEIEYITGDTEAPLFLGDATWGVRHINSPEVWQRTAGEITGNGVVVAVLDSGADLDHADLVQRFWVNSPEDLDGDGRLTRADKNGIDEDGNGFIDDVVGWDFESGDNDPSPNLFESGRARGHGTHVSGIIAGDGSNGVATGVAPGAKLMILKINSQRSVWNAMQYALVNGADILNMSIGWTESLSPDLATWRDAVDNLTDAGALVVTAAGSGGQSPMVHSPAPGDITTPGRVPRALTVAAVAEPTEIAWLDPVARFSSVGPVSWQSVKGFNDYPYPPGLMKPDVTAPGVNVTSTMIGGSYQAKSGTSMAVAHVSGLAALLLEQQPALLPHEIVFQVRETAWRFTDPNDVRGWGRIDALNAINFRTTMASYDLAIDKPNRQWLAESVWIDNNHDGNPDEPVAGSKNRIYARIQNQGGKAVGNAEIRFYYTNAGTLGTGISDFDSTAARNANFKYVGSYFAPVIGPAGSTQDTVTAAVDWLVPMSATTSGHWSLAVEVVSPNPPNDTEVDRANNLVVNNFFNVKMAPGQISTFRFYIHGDPRRVAEAFDIEVARDGLSQEFDIELSLDEATALQWVERMRGFEPVQSVELAEFPTDVADSLGKSISLLRDRGQLERVALTNGQPLLATLVIRAPEIDSDVYSQRYAAARYLKITTANDNGTFGGLTVNVEIDEDAAEVKQMIFVRK